MKSPQTDPNEVASAKQRSDFINCLLVNGLIAFVLASLVDMGYYMLIHSGATPGAGWIAQSLMNLLFGFTIGMVSLLVWRRGGAWPFLPHKNSAPRNLINGLFLGLILALMVMALVYSLLVACAGENAVDVIRQLRDVLFAQGEEEAYLGTKIIVTAAGLELTGKTESDPPR